MILCMDIGNTNIKAAVFQEDECDESVTAFRVMTDRHKTADEYGILFTQLLRNNDVDPKDITGIILSSVVPSVNFTIDHMCEDYFGRMPMTLVTGIKTGINVKYDNPRDLGSDRLASAVGAYELHGGPLIVIDFGTATTFGVISERAEFLGGCICPGLRMSSDALVERTSKLPKIELVKPDSIIGRGTVPGMQAGIIYGYVGLVNYIVSRIKHEMGTSPLVIATGGMANLIAGEAGCIDKIDGGLTLKGLKRIYDKNRGA